MKTPKRKRGRPVTGQRKYPVTAFVTKAVFQVIEKFAKNQKIARSEAVRRLIDLGIKAKEMRDASDGEA